MWFQIWFCDTKVTQSMLKIQLCFTISLFQVTLSFHILPALLLFKWSGRLKCQKKSWGLEECSWECSWRREVSRERGKGRRPKDIDLDKCSFLNDPLPYLTWQVSEWTGEFLNCSFWKFCLCSNLQDIWSLVQSSLGKKIVSPKGKA